MEKTLVDEDRAEVEMELNETGEKGAGGDVTCRAHDLMTPQVQTRVRIGEGREVEVVKEVELEVEVEEIEEVVVVSSVWVLPPLKVLIIVKKGPEKINPQRHVHRPSTP